jgi:hypothetical protein
MAERLAGGDDLKNVIAGRPFCYRVFAKNALCTD